MIKIVLFFFFRILLILILSIVVETHSVSCLRVSLIGSSLLLENWLTRVSLEALGIRLQKTIAFLCFLI